MRHKDVIEKYTRHKGLWTDDALVKIKTAAAKFPFRFISVRFVKGKWEVREF